MWVLTAWPRVGPCPVCTANAQRLARIEQQLKDAEENAGETEIREAYAARAEHYTLVGDKVRARTRSTEGLGKGEERS